MSKPLYIVADAHVWGVKSAFSHLDGFQVHLDIFENQAIDPKSVQYADILLTRSATQVNANLLQGSKVKFCATATIGDDHYDKSWLQQQGIQWASAAGSSTGSVLEYMLAALLELHVQGNVDLSRDTLGVVGAGRIGGKLAMICRGLGIKVLVNDPPRQREEGDDGFVDLGEILACADIVTLHTPLVRNGLECTHHLLGKSELSVFKGKAVINAARGACIDNQALIDWLNVADGVAVMDCWEDEPCISQTLLEHPRCVIATPHIAGHSLDGKAANTQYIYNALCDYLGIQAVWQADKLLPKLPMNMQQAFSWQSLDDLIHQFYVINDDVALLKSDIHGFVRMRRNYPIRRAWDKQSSYLASILSADIDGGFGDAA